MIRSYLKVIYDITPKNNNAKANAHIIRWNS